MADPAEQAEEADGSDGATKSATTRLNELARGAIAPLRTLAVVALVVAIPCALYYGLYFTRQTERFARHDFQVMRSYVEHLESETRNALDIVCNAALQPEQAARLRVAAAIPNGRLVEYAANTQAPGVLTFRSHSGVFGFEYACNGLIALQPLETALERNWGDGTFDALVAFDARDEGGEAIARIDLREDVPRSRVVFTSRKGAPIVGPPRAVPIPSPASSGDEEGAAAESASTSLPIPWLDALPRAQVGDARYLAFPVETGTSASWPARAAPLDAESEELELVHLVIVGLVRESRFRQEALSISPLALAALSAATLSLLLLIPYLRIRFMARHQRLRTIDMWTLGVSTWAFAVLTTCVVLAFGAHRAVLREADARLQAVADDVRMNATAEIEGAIWQLCESMPALLAEHASGMQHNVGSVLASGERSFPRFADFEALALADSGGEQLHKWMPRSDATPNVPLGRATYIVRSLALPWGCKRPAHSETKYEFESIDAPTSGLELGIFAVPTGQPGPAKIALIAAPLRSLARPATPYPFQFVVVDAQGSVLFRSNTPDRNRRESFYADLDPEGGAWVAAEEDAKGVRAARYRGVPHRFTVRSLPALKLDRKAARLIVFYDEAFTQWPIWQSLTSAIIGAGVAGLFTLAALLVPRFAGRDPATWLWPTVKRSGKYVVGAAGIATAWLLLAALFVRDESALVDAFAVAVLPAVLIAVLPLSRAGELVERAVPQRAVFTRHYKPLYLTFGLALILTVGVLPAGYFFVDAFLLHDAAMGRLVGERAAADALRRDEAWESRACPTPEGPVSASGCVPVAKRHAWVFTQQRFFPRLASAPQPAHSGPGLRCGIPAAHELGPLRHVTALFAACISPSSPLPSELHRWALAVARAPNAAGFIERHASDLLIPVFGLLGMCLVASWAFATIARRILGLEIEDDGILDLPAALTPGAGEKWLLIRPRSHDFEVFFGGCRPFEIDLMREQDVGAAPAGEVWHLRNIEAVVGADAELHASALAFIRHSHAPGTIVDSRGSLAFLFEQFPRDDPAARDALIQEWASALSAYRKQLFPLKHWDVPQAGTHSRLIWEECRWTPELRAIGALIASAATDDLLAEQVREGIYDAAEAHYNTLWARCSVVERVLLVQLAEEGFVNPRAFQTLARLRRRRIVDSSPEFRIMNQTFRRFVVEAGARDPAVLELEARAGQPLQHLSVPLIGLAAVATGLLAFSENATLTTALSVAGGAAGATGILRRLIDQLAKGARGAPSA